MGLNVLALKGCSGSHIPNAKVQGAHDLKTEPLLGTSVFLLKGFLASRALSLEGPWGSTILVQSYLLCPSFMTAEGSLELFAPKKKMMKLPSDPLAPLCWVYKVSSCKTPQELLNSTLQFGSSSPDKIGFLLYCIVHPRDARI